MEKTLEKLVLTRSFAVAPEKVWGAWIDADALRIWFGQTEATAWQAEWDVRADPVLDPRASDAWRGDFKRLGQLLQRTD